MKKVNKITGAQMAVKCLEEEGIEVVFGLPGGAMLPFYDAMLGSRIRHILVRHEQGAAHAADGYSRATGKIGVCIATSGPGVTNLITGIANAYMDSIPLVVITGQVALDTIGTDAFQETDTVGITAPITKHNYLVTNEKEIPRVMKEAFHIASTGRPGPVVVDIPVDIMKKTLDENIQAEMELPGYKPTFKGNQLQIKQAANLIYKSRRPIIFTGGGTITSGASNILTSFAREFKIPVINSFMGIGSFPGDDELSLGMVGTYGAKYSNMIFSEADLIIAVGVRFANRVTEKFSEFASKAKIIHIDIDPAEIGKIITPYIPIVGDARIILEDLKKNYTSLAGKKKMSKRDEWIKTLNIFKKKYPLKYDSDAKELKSAYIIEKVYEATQGDAIICTEVGQHQMWTALFYKFRKPRTFISSGGLGTMGFGLPASIGAKIGKPEKLVINIAGDGSLQMVIQELATANCYKVPVKIMLLNNGYLGMVRQLQDIYCSSRYCQVDISNSVDFVKLIEAYGGVGIRVKKKEEVEDAIKKAIEVDNIALIDFWVDRTDNVYNL